jgi:hypothetical protein
MAEAAQRTASQPARTLTMNAEGLTCDLFR